MYKIRKDSIAYFIYDGCWWKILTAHKIKPVTKILFLKGYTLEDDEEIEIPEDVYKILVSYCTPK